MSHTERNAAYARIYAAAERLGIADQIYPSMYFEEMIAVVLEYLADQEGAADPYGIDLGESR